MYLPPMRSVLRGLQVEGHARKPRSRTVHFANVLQGKTFAITELGFQQRGLLGAELQKFGRASDAPAPKHTDAPLALQIW